MAPTCGHLMWGVLEGWRPSITRILNRHPSRHFPSLALIKKQLLECYGDAITERSSNWHIVDYDLLPLFPIRCPTCPLRASI
ncbi:hypothetical protein TYRP_023297 [Tyrophagus putrescentiae]|nr:hypothetical protein TYRP_023297 [Tyrophagus putrescentiae]